MNPILFLSFFVVAVYSAATDVDPEVEKFAQTVKADGDLKPFYEEFNTFVSGLINTNDKFIEDYNESKDQLHKQIDNYSDVQGWAKLIELLDSVAATTLSKDLKYAINWTEKRLPLVNKDLDKHHLKALVQYFKSLDVRVEKIVDSAAELSKALGVIQRLEETTPLEQDPEPEAEEAYDVLSQQYLKYTSGDYEEQAMFYLTQVAIHANNIGVNPIEIVVE